MLIEPGSKISINDQVFTVIDGTEINKAEIKSDSSGHVYCVDLMNKIRTGDALSLIGSDRQSNRLSHLGILSLTDEQHAEARRRYVAILAILHMKKRTSHEKEEIRKQFARQLWRLAVSSRTIKRWIERYTLSGFKGLVTSESFGGKGGTRTDKESESILQKVIEEQYFTKQQKNKAEVYREFESESNLKGLTSVDENGNVRPPIPRSTIYRRLALLDQREVTLRRLGNRAYVQKHCLKGGRYPDVEYPLETILIDHTKLDIILRDPITRKPIGRPWITVAIDAFSRCIWAFYLSLEPPNADTVGLVIIIGCKIKSQLAKSLGCESEWPVYGLPSKYTLTMAETSEQNNWKKAVKHKESPSSEDQSKRLSSAEL